jgi:hypothetical protein
MTPDARKKLIILGIALIILIAIAGTIYILSTSHNSKNNIGGGSSGGGSGNGGGSGGGGSGSGGNGGGGVVTPPQPLPSGGWLQKHNYYRKLLGVNDLVWDNDLAKQSYQYASKINGGAPFEHGDLSSPICENNECGQNLDMGDGNSQSSPEAVDRWYKECCVYDGSPSENSGHYTQVVWKSASKVGCASVGRVGACLYNTGNRTSNGVFVKGEVPDNKTCLGISEGCKKST